MASCALFANEAKIEKRFELESLIIKDQQSEFTADENLKDAQTESIDSKSLVDRKTLKLKKAQHITEILNSQPNVEAIGSNNPLFKRIQVRGLETTRVTQKVDGVKRIEGADSSIAINSSIDTESLRHISISNGADSAKHGDGTLGGAINYQTLNGSDFLTKKKALGGEVKGSYDSATKLKSQVFTVAGKSSDKSDILLQYNTGSSEKFDSGIKDGQRISEDIKSRKEAGLIKYNYRVSSKERYTFKAQHQQSKTLESAFNSRFADNSSDYISRANDYLVKFENANFSSPFISLKGHMFSNHVYGEKDVKTAFRGIESTKKKTVDEFDSQGIYLENTSVIDRKVYQIISKQEVDFRQDNMKEDDGSDSPYFGESKGKDSSVALHNELMLFEDMVSVSLSGRLHSYARSSQKLAADVKDTSGTNHAYTLGLKLKAKNGVALFGKLGRSNRAPSVRELYKGGGEPFGCHWPRKVCSNQPNSALESEYAITKEVGLSYLNSNINYGDKIRLKVSYFNDAITDFIQTAPFMYRLDGAGNRVQAGPQNATHREYNSRNQSLMIRQGVEASASYVLSGFNAQISYSAMNMDCRDCLDMFTATSIDEEYFAAPADKIAFSLGYQFRKVPVFVNLDGKIVDTQERLSQRYLDAGYRTSAYQVYGLGVDYSPNAPVVGDLNFGVRINNFLDKQYTVHNSGSGKAELGRNIKFSLAKRF